MYVIISLFQLSVVRLPAEREEEAATYVEMGDTPRRPSSLRAGRFRLEPAVLTFSEELSSTLRRRGMTPAVDDAVPDPLVNLLVSLCKGKNTFPTPLSPLYIKYGTVYYVGNGTDTQIRIFNLGCRAAIL